jgi:hypothetical protein
MKSGTILATMFLAFAMSGCSRVYETIDMTPDGHEVQFKGIRDYLEDTESLHVLQTHGMGDNSAEDFCGERGENIVLQAEIIQLSWSAAHVSEAIQHASMSMICYSQGVASTSHA